MDLDRIDAQIVAALQNNARLSNKELASRIGIAPSTCLERVRKLEDRGAFIGFYADVSPAALGVGLQAMVSIRLTTHSRTEIETFRAHLLALREVSALYHVAGANDFVVHVAVSDTDHLRSLLMASFTSRPEVAHLETALIFEHTRKAVLPEVV
ncbi:MAG: Lrp/AsnC family transcriptional regulator [Rhodothermales bacterium]